MHSKLLKTAVLAAKAAGKKLTNLSVADHKLFAGKNNFEGYAVVKSKADQAAEKVVLGQIESDFPDHRILSEESDPPKNVRENEYVWIVDPLHGTTEYARGPVPDYSVTIAVARGNEVVCGVLYQPALNRLYTAVRGEGAQLNGESIAVSQFSEISKANLSIQHNAFKYGRYDKLVPLIKSVRRMYALGSAMFPEVAAGTVEAVISFKQATYDYAAHSLLVEEAGGRVTTDAGKPVPLHYDHERRYTIVATNGLLHDEILRYLS